MGGQEKHAQALVCIHRLDYGRVFTPFASLFFFRRSHAHSHRKRGWDGSGGPAHSMAAQLMLTLPAASLFVSRVCVHSQLPTEAALRASSSGDEQMRGSQKIPHVTGTVNEHRPARDQRKGVWGRGLKGRRRGNNSDPCSEIKATTQRGLTLSFTMRHFSGSKRQTVDTELVSQGSHIICRRRYLAGCPQPPRRTANRSGDGRGTGLK